MLGKGPFDMKNLSDVTLSVETKQQFRKNIIDKYLKIIDSWVGDRHVRISRKFAVFLSIQDMWDNDEMAKTLLEPEDRSVIDEIIKGYIDLYENYTLKNRFSLFVRNLRLFPSKFR